MSDKMTDLKSRFFLRSVVYDDQGLTLFMGDDAKQDCKIVFDNLRFYSLFKEGDFYSRIGKYDLTPIAVTASDPSLGVFKVGVSSMSSLMNQKVVEEEDAIVFLIITPDECVEIVSFSDPDVNQ